MGNGGILVVSVIVAHENGDSNGDNDDNCCLQRVVAWCKNTAHTVQTHDDDVFASTMQKRQHFH